MVTRNVEIAAGVAVVVVVAVIGVLWWRSSGGGGNGPPGPPGPPGPVVQKPGLYVLDDPDGKWTSFADAVAQVKEWGINATVATEEQVLACKTIEPKDFPGFVITGRTVTPPKLSGPHYLFDEPVPSKIFVQVPSTDESKDGLITNVRMGVSGKYIKADKGIYYKMVDEGDATTFFKIQNGSSFSLVISDGPYVGDVMAADWKPTEAQWGAITHRPTPSIGYPKNILSLLFSYDASTAVMTLPDSPYRQKPVEKGFFADSDKPTQLYSDMVKASSAHISKPSFGISFVS